MSALPLEEWVIRTVLLSHVPTALSSVHDRDAAARRFAQALLDGALGPDHWSIVRRGFEGGEAEEARSSRELDVRLVDVFRGRTVDWQRDHIEAVVDHVTVRTTDRRGSRFDPSRLTLHWRDGTVTRGTEGDLPGQHPGASGHPPRQLVLPLPELDALTDHVRGRYVAGQSASAIATDLGWTYAAVQDSLDARPSTVPTRGRFRVDDELVRRLYLAGLTQPEVAECLSVCKNTVYASL